jgi:hypothetical protein
MPDSTFFTPLEVSGFQDPPDWNGFVKHLQRPHRPLRVALPCSGIFGANDSFKNMENDYEAVHVFDLEPGYDNVTKYVLGKFGEVAKLGPIVGI